MVVGFCIAVAVSLEMNELAALALFNGFISSWLNYVVDRFGHRGPRRVPFMHSVLGVTLLCLALGIATYIASSSTRLALEVFVPVYAGALSHILLDSFTSAGVYPLYPFSKRKLSLARVRYDSSVANAVAVVLALLLVMVIALAKMGLLR